MMDIDPNKLERPIVTVGPKDQIIRHLNDRYFMAKIGGSLMFFEDRLPLAPMRKEAFKTEVAPWKVESKNAQGSPIKIDASKLWIESSMRRYYPEGFIFDSKTDGHTDRAYNLWRGYGVEAKEGDVEPLFQHFSDVVEEDVQDYLWKWICWVIQHPELKPKVAMVLRGGEGTGKGFIGQLLMMIFGHHSLHLTHKDHVTGRFNSHLRHVAFLFADEADFGGTDGENVLKTLITEPTMAIEAKGVDVKQEPSHIAMLMATNKDWAIPAGTGSRRYVVADVNSSRKGDAEYFNKLFDWLKSGGAEAVLHRAQAEDLGDFHPEKDRVVTQALMEQQINTLRGVDRMLFQLLWDGEAPTRLPSRLMIDEALRCGELSDPAQAIAKRLKDTSWVRMQSPRPVSWCPPESLQIARDELFPGVHWPDESNEWSRITEDEYMEERMPI